MKNDVILNKEQEKAMLAIDGAVLVTAGAGSGKTTVLTRRVANIIEKGLAKDPDLVMHSFVEKAKQEFLDKLKSMVENGEGMLTILQNFYPDYVIASSDGGYEKRLLLRKGI